MVARSRLPRMDAYVVSGRIRRATPHVARGPREGDRDLVPLVVEPDVLPLLADSDGRPIEPEPTPAERWDAFRERWSQMTFYLFDANSWR